MKLKFLFTLSVCALCLIFFTNCRKEIITTDPSAKLWISTDTVQFDTVFTTVGSSTHVFKVRNDNRNTVKISSIRLGGGTASIFRINVDGNPSSEVKDLEVAAHDSFYVFVETTVKDSSINVPFVNVDSVVFITNGNVQKVKLVAFGQGAHFFRKFQERLPDGQVITWTNDKPYVIFNSLVVPPGTKLILEKGVKVYNFSNSALFVLGQIEVKGTKEEPVEFRGTRLEHKYDFIPGQWYGIRILPGSTNNRITHAYIRNATIGIEVDSASLFATDTNLFLSKTRIDNMAVVGLFGDGCRISATNCLIHCCGQYNFLSQHGGAYKFINCTFDNSHSFVTQRKYPCFQAYNNDYRDPKSSASIKSCPLSLTIKNNIFWGEGVDNELEVDSVDKGQITRNISNNLIKLKKTTTFPNNIYNKDPRFKYAYCEKGDYAIDSASAAKNIGLPLLNDDMDDVVRDNSSPDVGCYEAKK